MSLPTRRLSKRLADLAIGQRFWFCPDATVPLAIIAMSEDPDTFFRMERVEQTAVYGTTSAAGADQSLQLRPRSR